MIMMLEIKFGTDDYVIWIIEGMFIVIFMYILIGMKMF